MSSRETRYDVKIPSSIAVVYCRNKRLLTFIKKNNQKSIRVFLPINLNKVKKIITVSSSPFSGISNKEKKKIKSNTGNDGCVT